jgi:hypothetical protein
VPFHTDPIFVGPDFRRIATELRSGNGDADQLQRLAELAVQWVIANPNPIPLAVPKYAR